jgi:hypothetical protein
MMYRLRGSQKELGDRALRLRGRMRLTISTLMMHQAFQQLKIPQQSKPELWIPSVKTLKQTLNYQKGIKCEFERNLLT